ncbi:MAG TPA: DoxX family protein [Dehalococcoidia bacterium]|jgi:putative oxidoreductase|nr:DoxX family protein [Dehalococcoidia bacterium]
MLKDLGLLVLRISTGLTMAAHGYPKLFGGPEREPPERLKRALGPEFPEAVRQGGPSSFAQTLEKLEVPSPMTAAYASGLAEFGGGLGLIFGFKTRLAALAILINLTVAIRKVHWDAGFFGQGGFEHPGVLWSSALALFLMGPGRISIDGEGSGKHDNDGDDDND